MSAAKQDNVLFQRAAIVGVGLIGASLGAALRQRAVVSTVVGVGRRRDNLNQALAGGCIDEASTVATEAVAGADLVIFAAPVDTSVALIQTLASSLKQGAVVTDVASVKAPLCEAAERAGIAQSFVGGHPLAGGTASGAAAADPSLFEEKLTVLTPSVKTKDDALAAVTSLWERCGARVRCMDAAEHDRGVAAVSHLPQFLAVCLAEMCGRDAQAETLADLAASGFESATRLADSDPEMWTAIATLNAQALADAADTFGERWKEIGRAIREGDSAAVAALMSSARAFRARLKK